MLSISRKVLTTIVFSITILLIASCGKPKETDEVNAKTLSVEESVVQKAIVQKPIVQEPIVQESKVWISGWKPSADLTVARAGAAVVTHNNFIYMIGGVDGKFFLSSIESSVIKEDGSLSPWKAVSNMPEQRGFMSAVVHESRLYVVGGGNGEYGKNLLNTIVSANLLSNGTIGSWREEKERLLLPRRCAKLIKKDNQLLALGGFGGALLDNVEVTTFASDGSLRPWKMNEQKLTMPRYVNSVTQMNEIAFVLGGHHPRKGVGLTEVEYVNLRQKPLKWQRTNSMDVARYAFSSFANNNRLYVAGGISGSEYLNSIEVTKVEVGNKLAGKTTLSWQKATNLPLAMANFRTIVVNERVFLIGGSSNENYLNAVWRAGFDKNGQLGYWGSQKELDALNAQQAKKKEMNHLLNAGTVVQSINTEGYTYLLVKEKGAERWLAAPKMEIKNNTRIQYSEGVYMSNFFSKTLRKSFKSIVFVGTVHIAESR